MLNGGGDYLDAVEQDTLKEVDELNPLSDGTIRAVSQHKPQISLENEATLGDLR